MPLLAGTQISVIRLWLLLAGGQGWSPWTGLCVWGGGTARFLAHALVTNMHMHSHVCPRELLSHNLFIFHPLYFRTSCFLWVCVRGLWVWGVGWGYLQMGSLQEVVGGSWRGKGNYNGGENKQDGGKLGLGSGHMGAIYSLLVQWEPLLSLVQDI